MIVARKGAVIDNPLRAAKLWRSRGDPALLEKCGIEGATTLLKW
jgi:hypothetical protein